MERIRERPVGFFEQALLACFVWKLGLELNGLSVSTLESASSDSSHELVLKSKVLGSWCRLLLSEWSVLNEAQVG